MSVIIWIVLLVIVFMVAFDVKFGGYVARLLTSWRDRNRDRS